MPKKYAHKGSYDKSKPTNILSPNRYQLLKTTSENIELVSENIQNTDALSLLGYENNLNRNKNVLTSQNIVIKRPSVVINKYPKKQTEFSRPPIVPGTKLFTEASLPSKGQTDILIFTDSIPRGFVLQTLTEEGKRKHLRKDGLHLVESG